MPRVLLNIDLGELPDEPDALYALAHIANIACGGHAGDARSMAHALAMCAQFGTQVSAHPSYPDRANFGRVRMNLAPDALRASIAEQCRALAQHREARVKSMKPHGALYHDANGDPALARALVQGAIEALGHDITVLGPSHGALADECAREGITLLAEGFADRGARVDDSLIPRGEPGALITDPSIAAERARELARSGRYGTICVHGDTPGAEAIARAVRAALS